LQRISSGAIDVREGEEVYVKSPTDVGSGKAKDEKAPLSEIIEILNMIRIVRVNMDSH
jgi:type I restriction enzyme R subunit